MFLEHDSQRRLHDAWRTARAHLSKLRINLIPLIVESRNRVDVGVLERVEEIVNLPTNLNPPSSSSEGHVLDERQIVVIRAWAPQRSFPRIADLAAACELDVFDGEPA